MTRWVVVSSPAEGRKEPVSSWVKIQSWSQGFSISDSLQNNAFLCNMKIFTLMIRKIPHLRLEDSWRQQWWLCRKTDILYLFLPTLCQCLRWSIAKIHLAPQPGAGQLCLVSETPCRFLWKNVSPPKEDVSLLLPALLELLRSLSGSSQHIVKARTNEIM